MVPGPPKITGNLLVLLCILSSFPIFLLSPILSSWFTQYRFPEFLLLAMFCLGCGYCAVNRESVDLLPLWSNV
uniref:Uncharacterized protein n=1 Tax=Mus musculus TaxID=10090 RepID=Q3UUS7_MOUSE|nr:unnamed protein product [Mus musculus]